MNEISPLSKLLYLLLPIVLAGVCNMAFVKLPILDCLKSPMDNGRVLKDGFRLFGNHKTWKGFFGMIIFSSFWGGIALVLAENFQWAKDISLLPFEKYGHYAWLFGGVVGLGYVLAELPNSYIKRRVHIEPGAVAKGMKGIFFQLVDHSDSVIGCMLFMLFFYHPRIADLLALIILGIVVHYAVNLLLGLIKLKTFPG